MATVPFRISDAVFIESAYISGEAKMSISTVPTNGRALGPTNVEAIIGLPGGMFVLHRGGWNFCPWANVKSARLIDVPPEVVATAAGDLPVVVPLASAPAPAKYEPPKIRRKAVVPVEPVILPAAAATVATEPAATVTYEYVPPAVPPERDEMGVLKSLQPTTGPQIECAACGTKFIQGANHVCKRVDDLMG